MQENIERIPIKNKQKYKTRDCMSSDGYVRRNGRHRYVRSVFVTNHAVERYQERFAACDFASARKQVERAFWQSRAVMTLSKQHAETCRTGPITMIAYYDEDGAAHIATVMQYKKDSCDDDE